jgi:hypothetical protein
VVLDVTPFGKLGLTNRANITMLLAPMFFHVQKAVAFEITDLALELDDSGVNSFVSRYLELFEHIRTK